MARAYRPNGSPQQFLEYYEIDRTAINVWSTFLKCSGIRIIDNVIDNAHFPFVHPGILGDSAHLELGLSEPFVDAGGTLWSCRQRAWLPIAKSVAEYSYRVADPYSVILHIHRPDTPDRDDFLGIFAQPLDEENFIAHKMLAWITEEWMEPGQLKPDQQWISAQDKYVLERLYYGELSLNRDGRDVESEQLISCIDLIERKLPRIVPLQGFDKDHSVIDVLQSEISSLADQYKRMLDGLARERAEIRVAADEERQAARQAHETAMQEVEAAAKEQKRQFDEYRVEQEAALAHRTMELDERENDLDNRQHMHARRELREKISENFKERISKPVVSGPAKIMQWAVFVLTLSAGIYLGVLGLIDFRTLIETSSAEGFPGWLAAGWAFRSIVVLGVSIGFVAYAINWLRNVYLDDVRTRRQYERYGHDIDRASFVIETIMEVDEKEKTLAPETWIDGVCRNLFRNNADDTSDNPSANVAAVLLESISGARIGPDGTEVSMDRRGVRRFAKKIPGG